MINRTNTFLAVVLAAVVVMTAFVRVDYSKPNIEILPDMKYTLAWEAFAANPNFPNKRTMQPPLPGTIARGQMPLYYAATKEDAVRAGEELENPSSRGAIEAAVAAAGEVAEAVRDAPKEVASSGDASPAVKAAPQNENARRAAMVHERFSASVEHGGEVYRTFCVSCHGPSGAGDGPVTQRGFPPPPSMLTGKSLQMKDGQLFHILTYGQGSMAPFAAQISRERRWDVINYVRDLQRKAPAVPATEPTATEQEPPAKAENAEATDKPESELESEQSKQPADETKKTSAEESTEKPEKKVAAPPNALREAPADNEKPIEAPGRQVPPESEPNTDAKS